jgi:hypothetical protein
MEVMQMPATKPSATPAVPATEPKAARLRSPAYPGIDLEAAIKRAQELYDREHRSAANAEIAVQHWGFKPTSGGGFVVIAALKAFGLISDSGSGKTRKIQLSELALRILLDRRSDSTERQEAIKQAALMPKIHASLWTKYGREIPSNENLAHELVFERKFNENSVKDFIKEYRDTIEFAKLSNSDTVSLSTEDIEEDSDMPDLREVIEKPVVISKKSEIPGTKEISLPVGMSEDGQAIFAHVRFDAPLKKGMLLSLKQLLDVLEKTLN